MDRTELNRIFSELAQYKRIEEEAKRERTALEDQVKAMMTELETDILIGDEHKVTWKAEIRNTIDTKKLKADHPELAAEYTKASESRKFLFS